jgi:hypothetical protein
MSNLPPLPEAPPSRHIGEGYSYNHPVPTVQKYRDDKKGWDKEADEYAAQMERMGDARSVRDDETSTIATSNTANGTAPSINGKRDGHATGEISRSNAHSKADGPAANDRHGRKRDAVKSPGQQEKEEMMDRMNANKEKPTDRLKKGPHGERRVRSMCSK